MTSPPDEALRQDLQRAMGPRADEALGVFDGFSSDLRSIEAPATVLVVGLMNAGKAHIAVCCASRSPKGAWRA